MATAFQAPINYVDQGKAYQRAYYLKHQEKRIAYQRHGWAINKNAANANWQEVVAEGLN